MKKFLVFTISFMMIFAAMALCSNVNATEAVTEVSTYAELTEAVQAGGTIKLVEDINATNHLFLQKDATLDLNGHTLAVGNNVVSIDAKVVVKDTSTNGNGIITNSNTSDYYTMQVQGDFTLESGTIQTTNQSYAIYAWGGSVTINGGQVEALQGWPVSLADSVNFEMNGGTIKTEAENVNAVTLKKNSTMVMNGGSIISTKGYGIVALTGTDVTINNGTIEAYRFALTGNGSPKGKTNDGTEAKFTVNGGTLTSANAAAIYAPQIDGETTITGGTIKGVSGIEIRAGKLTVSGGTIIATAEKLEAASNGNGSTTTGAGIAITQHNTKQPITVTISGGTIKGCAAVYECNPQNNPEEDTDKITVKITGGNLEGIIASEDDSIDATAYEFEKDEETNMYYAKKKIDKFSVTGIKNKTYTGEEITQSIVVKDGETTLTEGTDYTAAYDNNTNPGKATITITGKGNYAGTISKTFIILPEATKISVKSQDTSWVEVKWNKVTGASGYEVYMATSKDGKYTKIATIKGNSTLNYKKTGLKAGTAYYLKARPYVAVDGTNYYGGYSGAVNAITKLVAPTLKVKAGSEKATLSWNKVAGASGYEVYMAASKNGTYRKITTIKKGTTVTYTKKGLRANRTYYFKVRAYKTVDGKNVYSKYSSNKSIKIQKLYKVKKGDNLTKLAKRFGTTINRLVKLNHIKNRNFIKIGWLLRIF